MKQNKKKTISSEPYKKSIFLFSSLDTLEFPDHYCDVPLTVRLIKDCHSVEDILAISSPRTAAELLDACDLIFCLDWACVDARIYNLTPPAKMDGSRLSNASLHVHG